MSGQMCLQKRAGRAWWESGCYGGLPAQLFIAQPITRPGFVLREHPEIPYTPRAPK